MYAIFLASTVIAKKPIFGIAIAKGSVNGALVIICNPQCRSVQPGQMRRFYIKGLFTPIVSISESVSTCIHVWKVFIDLYLYHSHNWSVVMLAFYT